MGDDIEWDDDGGEISHEEVLKRFAGIDDDSDLESDKEGDEEDFDEDTNRKDENHAAAYEGRSYNQVLNMDLKQNSSNDLGLSILTRLI